MLSSLLIDSALAAASDDRKLAFDIPAASASKSLKQFSLQSGEQVLYSNSELEGVTTNEVKGAFTTNEALGRLLSGTPLIATRDHGAIAIGRGGSDPNAQRAARAVMASDRPALRENRPDGAVTLDPFEVTTSRDTSYGALNSNSITRFNTELDKMPVSADILTSAFMQDVDVTTIDSLIMGYGGGMGMAFGNPPGQSAATQPGDRNNTTGFTVRGLNAGGIRMNGFVTEASNFATTTNFDIQRVEIIHGPQGLLYGPGGAGGIIVATTDQAQFRRTSASVKERIDQFGSKRTLLKVNEGSDRVAATFDVLYESTRYSRLYFSSNDVGYYGQFAFRLPLNTTLRTDYSYTRQNKTGGGGGPPTVNFGGATVDPRHGQNLAYLLYTNQIGATNPATGAPYSKFGAIGNGLPDWSNIYTGYAGMENWEIAAAYNFDITLATVWRPWLSTNVGFNYNRINDQLGPGTTGQLYAPGVNGNPFDDWAVDYTPSMSVNNRRHKNFRADVLVKNDIFRVGKSQTTLGYDYQRQGAGGVNFGYYLSDANGNQILTPGATNLGRTTVPLQWWPVGKGVVFQSPVNVARGIQIFQSPQDGRYYVKQIKNPSVPAFVTPANPLGLASYQPGTGVTNADYPQGNYDKRITNTGLSFANYTSWWDDLFTTMVGYRYTYTANHIPNTGVPTYGVYDTTKFGSPAYNVGVDGRITRWLRWFADYSANHNVSNGNTDFYGRLVDVTHGRGGEVGLKFTPLDSKISGSFDFYVNSENDYAVNSGGPGAVQVQINPGGLNGQYQGAAGTSPPYGTYFNTDRQSKGFELNLYANPLPNWSVRLVASTQNGSNKSDVSYGILYNDQFYTDSRGGVTYANGTPFLVPVTPGTSLSTLNSSVNPNTAILAGVPTTQLTTAMIGDPSSPYYAWQGGPVTPAGNILLASNVGRALQYFNVPGTGGDGTARTGATGLPISKIQYAWPDPNHTGGTVIVARSGTPTVGYPQYAINLVNRYQITSGPLKGLGAVLALNDQWRWRTYLYNTPTPTGTQQRLWTQRSLGLQVNLNPFYERKFGRYLFRTQLDINNLTNHYVLELIPNNGSGFTNPNNLAIRWDNQPRSYVWTNTLSF